MEYLEWKEKYYTGNEEYFKKYYKKYHEENKRHCIYLLIDKNKKVKYVGSTDNIYNRINLHTNGYSNLELTKEKWNDLGLSHFMVGYLDSVNKQERLYIEYYLINKFSKENDLINNYEPYELKFKDIEEFRKCELEELAESLVFQVYS